jgi:phosphatidylserine/phosphatidylglycerophosphate/cardiolipin synthase-like enzyme
MIVDETYSVLGDRNIGAEYFEEWAGADVLLIGDVSSKLSKLFVSSNKGLLRDVVDVKSNHMIPKVKPIERTSQPLKDFLTRTKSIQSKTTSRPLQAEILCHIPRHDGYDSILHAIIDAVRSAQSEVCIRSCYVVLCRPLRDVLLVAMKERNVKVRILTNSIDTNDLLFIHAAMCESLVELVGAGALVYVFYLCVCVCVFQHTIRCVCASLLFLPIM